MRYLLTVIALFAFCLSLTACQSPVIAQLVPPAEPAPTFTYTPFQAHSPTPRPTFTLTPTLTLTATQAPSPTPPPCTAESGRIEAHEMVFEEGGQPFGFRVYLPPCFDEQSGIRYPVLYMIHGQTFNDDQWERLGIGPAADALINAEKAPPFIIIMPREDDTFSDIYTSPFSRTLINNLIPWVDATYPTCAERACRAIGGLSRGGAWSLRLGFIHWELFGAVGLHSTPPFTGDPQMFVSWLRAIPPDQIPAVYMDTGSHDAFLSMTTSFESLLVSLDVPHEWYLFNGLHEEAYWADHVSDYLEWYTRPWNNLDGDQLIR